MPRKVCSAYSSAFILDQQERVEFFSDFKKVNNSSEKSVSSNITLENNNIDNSFSQYPADNTTDSLQVLTPKFQSRKGFLKSKKATRKSVDESYLIASSNTDAAFFYVPKKANQSRKNKYGIIGEKIKRQKRLWRRVEKVKKWPKVFKDSLSIDSLFLQYDSLNMDKSVEQIQKDSVKMDAFGFGKKRGIINEDQMQYLMYFGKYLPKRKDNNKLKEKPTDKTDFPDEAITDKDIDEQLYEGFDNTGGLNNNKPKYDENIDESLLTKEEKKARKKAAKLKRKEEKRLEKEDKKRYKKIEKERLKREKSNENNLKSNEEKKEEENTENNNDQEAEPVEEK